MHREPQPREALHDRPDVPLRRTAEGSLPRALAGSVEAIGTEDPAIDAEVIQLYDTLLRTARRIRLRARAELDRLTAKCRPALPREAARRGWRRTRGRLDEETREQAAASPLRALDNIVAKPPHVQEALRRGADDRRVALRRMPRAFRCSPRRPRRLWCRLHARARRSCAVSTTTRARRGSSSGRGRARQSTISGGGRYDGLDRGDRWPADPGGRLRRRASSGCCSRSRRQASPPSRRAPTSSSRSTRARRVSACSRWMRRLRASRASPRDTDYAGRSLKGQLTQAARLGAADDRGRARDAEATIRRRGGGGRARSSRRDRAREALAVSRGVTSCAASRGSSTSAGGSRSPAGSRGAATTAASSSSTCVTGTRHHASSSSTRSARPRRPSSRTRSATSSSSRPRASSSRARPRP